MTKLIAIVSILFASSLLSTSARADEFSVQFAGKRDTQNGQKWLTVCLINQADAKIEADLQFAHHAKPEKWKTYKISDGGALIIGQTFLEETDAPKVWVKYTGTDAAASWTTSLAGTVTAFRPRKCTDVQRAAFVEETDGQVTLKVLP